MDDTDSFINQTYTLNGPRYIPNSNSYKYVPSIRHTYDTTYDQKSNDKSDDKSDGKTDDETSGKTGDKLNDKSNDKLNDKSEDKTDEKKNPLVIPGKIVEPIDINNIMYEVFMRNKIIIFATIPLFVGYYLQDTIFTRSVAAFTSDIPEFVRDVDLNKIVIMLLPYIVAMILFYISSIVTSKAMTRIELDSIQELTDRLIESIRTSKKNVSLNDLMIHIKKMAGIKNIYSLVVTYIVPTFIVAITLIYTFSQSDGYYGLIVAFIIIVMMLITIKLEFDSILYAFDTEDSSNVLFDEIHEIMTNIDSVITSNTKEEEMKRITNVKNKTYNLAMKSQVNNNNSTYSLQGLSVVAMLGINYMAYRLYVRGLMDSVLFTSSVLLSLLFMDYYNYCISAISDLISSVGRYCETREYFLDYNIVKDEIKCEDKMKDEIKYEDKMKDQIKDENFQKPSSKVEPDRKIILKITQGNIVFKNFTLTYEGRNIFNKFNFVIEGGRVTGFVGPIGSGKTTMLKALAGILEYEGDIIIDGQKLKNCTYESIVANIAYIPQHPKLFNRTVYYNVNYGSSYKKEEILKRLKILGLKPFIDSLQKGIDTVAGKEGSKLSGGQRQFVSLIRAIMQNKSIFLLDEPSSSLDATNKDVFINLIRNMKDKTIIISTHDKQIMTLFNKTFNMSKKSLYEN